MKLKKSLILSAFLMAIFAFPAGASSDVHHSNDSSHTELTKKQEIKQHIQHHLLDAYDFHLFTDEETNTHYGFPLPVILIDEGLHVFMSSAFHHGETVAESNGKYYALYHNHIYNTDAEGTIHYNEEGKVTNAKPLDFSITKNVFSIIFISLLIFWLFASMAKTYRSGLAPTGAAKFLEPLVLYVRDEIARPCIGEKKYENYMSYLLTVFFFIWITNLFGMTPLGINVTGNIAITFTLALMTFIITQAISNKDYWLHIFWMPGVPYLMRVVLAPIELLGLFIKPFSLMIRLFANMTAGHVVLMSLIGLLFVFENWFARGAFLGLTLFLSIIELLVAFLQAYIFTMLTALYFGGAVAEHDHQ